MKIKQQKKLCFQRLMLLISILFVILGGCAAKAVVQTLSENPATEKPVVPEQAGSSTVYFTSVISPAGLMTVYSALGQSPSGRVAVKLSTGEPPNSNYLRPELIKDLVQSLNGTIVESNTAYGGRRASTAIHKQVARDHGFTAIADVDILDEDGSISLPVDCDCNGNPAEPDMHDIGILASLDPVALDQACVDLVYASPDRRSLIQRTESRNGIRTIDHGAEIGLGSKTYELVRLNG
jgi:uncharacterized Fe-S center protein